LKLQKQDIRLLEDLEELSRRAAKRKKQEERRLVLYPESGSDDRMLASRSEAGYRKRLPDNN
jgi:hypothetical protein